MKAVCLYVLAVNVMLAMQPCTARSGTYDPQALRAERATLPLDAVMPTRAGAFEDTPDEAGAYIYEATALRPLVEGAHLSWSTNTTAGLVVGRITSIRQPESYYFKDHQGAYWKLGAIREGDYWLGLLRSGGALAVYVNGRVVQMGSATEALRVASGMTCDELRAAGPVRLKPGDEVAVVGQWGGGLVRLILRPEAPPAGRHYVAPHYGPHTGGPETALAVTGQAIFYSAAGTLLPTLKQRDGGRNQRVTGPAALEKAPDGRPAVRCELFNPLPTPVEVEYSVAVRSYYRLPVGGESARLRLEPHARVKRLVAFDALPDERAFSAELTLRVVEPKVQSAWRKAMNWPALDWIEFFPGYRQGLAWPESFADYDLRRVEFGDPVRAVRRRLLLDGGGQVWQQAYSTNWQARWPATEALDWVAGEVPAKGGQPRGRAADEPPAQALYLRRTFVLPADAADESCELRLEETSHEAAIYVNGVEVGRVRGGNTPLWADATAAAHPGTNELVLVVRNALAIMDPAYIDPDKPEPNLDYLDAPGIYDAWRLGAGSVELRMAPRVAARDLQVIPSTRHKTLGAHFTVVNNRDRALKLKVLARVFDADQPVFDLGERDVELAPGASAACEFSKPWADAHWWWPFDPHLYVMAVETVDAATGERLDLLRERFGFRESWIDGPDMMLNDMAIRPKGSWLGYREAPNHFARGVDGSAGPDWSDERGMMGGTYITMLSNTSSRHNVERDAFWEAAASNAMRAIRPRINNPSVARWDMSNEWLQYLDHPNPMLGARRFKALSDMIRAIDPTRWTTFGAEGDVYGLLDHFDFHYMSPYFGGEEMRGVYAYLPDGEYWRELDKDFVPGAPIPLCPFKSNVLLRPDQKMMFERESMWKVGGLMPPGTAAFAGENVILWPDWDVASGPSLWHWKQKVDGPRDLGVSMINHFTHPGFKRRAMPLQTFIVPEVQHHGFGGRTIERRYAVLQDLFRTCDMTFRWTLRGPNGKTVDAGGEDRQRMTSGTTHRGLLRVKLPGVEQRAVCTLLLELESDGELVMAEERDIDVWPDGPVNVGKLDRKVVLFEGGERSGFDVQSGTVQSARVQSARVQSGTVQSARVQSGTVQSARAQSAREQSGREQSATVHVEGAAPDDRLPRRSNAKPGHPTTAAALTAAGVPFERITDLGAPILTDAHPHTRLPLLVIAEEALNDSNRGEMRRLNGFVEQGGRVLILRQTVAPGSLPAETSLDARHWASQCFIRAGNHPVVKGWTDWDFHFWAGDRSVVQGAYIKPSQGPATAILDSGEISQQNNLEWTGLVEMYRGAGLYLLCQLPVAAKYDAEPMAREVFARMIDYMAAGEAFRTPTATLTVVADPDGPMVQRLEELGASVSNQCSVIRNQCSAANAILVDAAAGRGLPAAERAALRERLHAGATVVVAQGGGEDEAWLGELAGRPVRFAVQPREAWDGRGMRAAWTKITAGLSQVDEYWKRFDGYQSARRQQEQTTYIIERFRNTAVRVEGDDVVESVWPGTVLEVPCGAGRLILDQRNLYTLNADLVQRAARNLSALVLGVGGRLAPAIEYPDMPERVGYKPIDLSPWANRAFADDIPEDGKGGWTDQGAGADLREFPTHNRRLGGVPFVFPEGTNTCIVLSSRSRPFPEQLPLSVTIPIGEPIAGLYFLHAAAYGGRPSALYEIRYADGTTASIRLESGVNIRDWVKAPPDLPRERGTQSVLAWTGSTPRFKRVGVYRMEWVNPHPEKIVTAVRYYKPAKTSGVPVLMGLTAAVTGAAGMGPTEEERTRAVELAREAAAALAADDTAGAEAKVKQALALDDGCEDAHAVRGDLADRRGNEDERLAVYQEWIDTGATRPRPYNQVGGILEKRGNLRGALDAYRQSLKVEWNQPPILDARSRLEQEVK